MRNASINHQESARCRDIFTCVNVLWWILQYLHILWAKRYTWTLLHFLAKHKRKGLTLLFSLTENLKIQGLSCQMKVNLPKRTNDLGKRMGQENELAQKN